MLLGHPGTNSAEGREHLLSSQDGLVARQYKKQIFKASFATSQFPSANPPFLSTCTLAE